MPFRNTVINNEQFVEDRVSEPKKIGGIEVDQSEVIRAKKCKFFITYFINLINQNFLVVELLKRLFIDLQETQEKAISPEYDLAYMALLNEKDDDDNNTATDVLPEEPSASSSTQNVVLSDTKETTTTSQLPLTRPELGSTENTGSVDSFSSAPDTFENEKNLFDDELSVPISGDETPDENVLDMLESEDGKELHKALSVPVSEPEENVPDQVIEDIYRRTSLASDIQPPNSPPPSYEDVVSDADEKLHFEDDIKKPMMDVPKVKERPSVDTMMFGKQQDVTGIYF